MSKTKNCALTAHVSIQLEETVDQVVEHHEWFCDRLTKQGFLRRIGPEVRDRLTLEALADVDAGHVLSHQSVRAWADNPDVDHACSTL